MQKVDKEKEIKLKDKEIGMLCNRYLNLYIAYNVSRFKYAKRAIGTSYLKLKFSLGLTAKQVIDIYNQSCK